MPHLIICLIAIIYYLFWIILAINLMNQTYFSIYSVTKNIEYICLILITRMCIATSHVDQSYHAPRYVVCKWNKLTSAFDKKVCTKTWKLQAHKILFQSILITNYIWLMYFNTKWSQQASVEDLKFYYH